MWKPWGKSTSKIHNKSSSSSFSCSSFKDIQTLILQEPPQQPLPSSQPTTKQVFHRVLFANTLLRAWSSPLKLPRSNSQPENPPNNDTHAPEKQTPQPSPPKPIYFPGTEQRVVIYFTSLRVVRPIFEDCKSALTILRAFHVHLDERDVSIDSSFLTELNRIMDRTGQTGLTLPRVFIAGKYIGGGEEIRSMHEIGELKKMLEDLPVVDPIECHVCAGHRFVLCNVCNGSRKVYNDKVGFKVCNVCNENGLRRCPSCFPNNNEIKNIE